MFLSLIASDSGNCEFLSSLSCKVCKLQAALSRICAPHRETLSKHSTIVSLKRDIYWQLPLLFIVYFNVLKCVLWVKCHSPSGLFVLVSRASDSDTPRRKKYFLIQIIYFFVVQPSPADSMNDIVALCSVEVKHICKQFFIEILQFSWLFIVKGEIT